MLLWNPDEPPPPPQDDLTLHFVFLTLVMWLVVVLAQMFGR